MRRIDMSADLGARALSTRVLTAVAAFGLVVSPVLLAAPAAAQDPVQMADAEDAPPASHQVVRGNTLWDLAADFYGNPYLWPRIYEANQDRIEDPHWIYPGQVLRIPDGEGRLVEVTVVAPGDEPVERDMRLRPEVAAQEEERTVFYPRERAAVDLVVDRRAEERLAVSHSSFYSAEWLEPEGRAAAEEAVGRVVGFAGSEGSRSGRVTARPIETLQVALQPDARLAVGDLLQTYRPVRTEEAGTIVRPTGMLVVRRLTPAGAEATISATFMPIQIDDFVRLAPSFPLRPGMHPAGVDAPLTARIVAVGQVRAIHSLRDVMILDRGADAGVRVGDEFVFVTRQPGFADRVEGRVRVVGVRPTTSSARIADVDNPVFEVGAELVLDRRIP